MKKIFSILALALVAMTASAYNLTVGTNEHGTVTFKVGGSTVTTANENDVVTVEITPASGWSTAAATGKWYAAVANAPRHAQDIDLLKDFELTPVVGNKNAYTFTMQRANAEISVSYKKQLTHTDISIDDIQAVTYNGLAQTPAVTVKDGQTELTLGTDYTVAYSNNVNAGTATVTVTAEESSNYSGTTTKNFTIQKADIEVTAENVNRSFSPTDSYGITVNVTKPASGATVTYGTTADDCTLSASPTFSNIGTYTVYYKVTAPNYNDYTGQATVTIGKASGYVYYPTRQVNKTYGDASFVNEVVFTGDGTMSYASSKESVATVDAATGLVTIKGVGTTTIWATMSEGESYQGDWHSYTLTVGKADLSKATIALAQTSYEYDGSEKKPAVLMVVLGNSMLQADAYSVGYGNNVNAGKATVTVSGQGNYTGEASTTFTITPKTITDDNVTIVDGGTDNRQLTIHDKGNQQGGIVTPDLEVSTLNYDRSLPASEVNAYTVCLPYAPSTEGGLKYYTLTGVEGSTLQFTEISGAPLAYTPYLVFASSSTDIGKTNVTNVTMSKEVDGSTAGSYELKGTLSGISHDDAQGFYILQSGNRWAKIGSDTHAYIPPFRAYIVSAAAASAPAVDYLDNEFHDAGSATGIDSMRTTDRNGTERWFDLNGRRIEKPTTKGIYIHNGRKEIAK